MLAGRRDAVTKNGSTVVKVGETAEPLSAGERTKARAGKQVKQQKKDQYVELSREKTDRIFVVLAELGNERHPSYPNQNTDPIRGQAAQPLFDDTRSYWNAETPSKSVKLPRAGVTLRVTQQEGISMKVRLGTSAGGLRGAATR